MADIDWPLVICLVVTAAAFITAVLVLTHSPRNREGWDD